MRATTVRFAEDLWEMLEREAETQGISTAQLIREAALIRVAALAARRGDAELELSVEKLAERSRGRRAAASAGDVRDPQRLGAVRGTGLLDTSKDGGFSRIADMARRVLNAPVALITLIDADRQVFVASPGLKEPWASRGETPLAYSFCRDATVCRDPLVIPDARLDPEFRDNPAVAELDVVAYLGVPLIDPDDHALGALCVVDSEPRTWTSDQVAMLETLAVSVVDRIAVLADAS